MAIMEGWPQEVAVGQVQQARWRLLPVASVAAAPCLMGPWEYLLGAFISGVGWPGRGFIYTQSSGTDAWSPPLLTWSPSDLPSPGENTGAGLPRHSRTKLKSTARQNPSAPHADLQENKAHCQPWAKPAQGPLSQGHLEPFRGRGASGPAKCPCTHGHCPAH